MDDIDRDSDDRDNSAGTAPTIDSRATYVAALRWGFARGIAQPARRIVCADTSLADWPLDDTDLLATLTSWLRLPQRRLVLLASHHDELPRRCPRFNRWRVTWAHAIEAWQLPADVGIDVPCVLLAGDASVQLIDAPHWRGRASHDPRVAHQWSEQLDAILQRCEAGMPVHPLGL